MKIITNLANYIQNLNKKEFEKYLAIFLGIIMLFCITALYKIYNNSSVLIRQIKTTQRLVRKAELMIQKNKSLDKKEEKLQTLLKANKEFSIRTFLEQFWTKNQIKPEPGWGETRTIAIPGNDNFDEIELTAIFKNQNTQKLTNIIDKLNKKDNIYTKELTIKREPDSKITFDITLATMKYKKNL